MTANAITGARDLEAVARAICEHKLLAFGGRIGHGTYKETYLVRRPPSNKPFALKLIKPGMRPERIHRELLAMHRCRHANIVALRGFDSYTAGDRTALYFVEDYLAGGTLAQRIIRGNTYTPAQIRNLARQLSAAISYLAAIHLVHRDITPENIMFDVDGTQPILTDFSLVRDVAQDSFALTLNQLPRGPGTPFYAAPEQLNNRRDEIDWRTDQFALGAVLSVAAFGFHPYSEKGESTELVTDRVAAYGTHSQRFLAAAKSAALEPLVRMTCALPDRRYSVPADLKTAWEVG